MHFKATAALNKSILVNLITVGCGLRQMMMIYLIVQEPENVITVEPVHY